MASVSARSNSITPWYHYQKTKGTIIMVVMVMMHSNTTLTETFLPQITCCDGSYCAASIV